MRLLETLLITAVAVALVLGILGHRAVPGGALSGATPAGLRASLEASSAHAARTMSTPAGAPSEQARRQGAVMGALVGDAATMGLHWIYDTSKLAALLASKGRQGAPEFFEPPSCPFYQMPSGALSPYGAEVAALLRYVDANGSVDGPGWTAALAGYFESVYPGYKNKSVRTLIASLKAGKAYPEAGDAADTQANMLCKVPVVVARYAGSPELPAAVEAAVRAQQNNGTAVAYGLAAAAILERVVLGKTVAEAIDWAATGPAEVPAPARAAVAAAAEVARSNEDLASAVQRFGASCAMPGALQGALVAARRAKGYEDGLRANMVAGGDNCSRACYLGALLGAAAGGAPEAWAARVAGAGELGAQAERVAAAAQPPR